MVTPSGTGASPVLTLCNGAYAAYTEQDGSGNLVFRYTVAQGQSTSDLKVTGLDLRGGTIGAVGVTSFSQPASFSAGPGSYASTVADLNGDGAPDVVVANDGDATISVLLADGNGGFANRVVYNLPGGSYSTYSLASADLNGDGEPDILAADGVDGAVLVFLNDGRGNLLAPTSYSDGTGQYTGYAIQLADVNGDGKPDVIAAGSYTGTVSVLLGDGQGGFTAATPYTVGPATDGVAVADVNGDGKPDLVVVNADDTVSVLLGNGLGNFGQPTSYQTGLVGDKLLIPAVSDLNGDGLPDIVVPNRTDGTVSVLLNNGDGTFGPQTVYAVGSNPTDVIVADVNRDSKPDLVIANDHGGTVSVLLGNGNGTFQPQVTFGAGTNPDTVTAIDVTGDSEPDLVVSGFGGTVSVLTNTSVTPGDPLDTGSVTALAGADTGLVIDTTGPTLTALTASPSAPGPLGAGRSISFVVSRARPSRLTPLAARRA